MKETTIEKWIEGIDPEEHVGAAAARILENRLGAVLHYLPLAAEKAEEEVEHVHQLRVWTRRATAALLLYEELIPRRRFEWTKKQLRLVRHAANEARDCDVLLQRMQKSEHCSATKSWRETVRAEREEAQAAIVAVHARLHHGRRLERRIGKLLKLVRHAPRNKSSSGQCFGEWASEHLLRAVERFFDAIPSETTNAAGLHRLRIRGKELRYSIELLAGTFPATLRGDLYPVLEEMLDRLGEINDLATAKKRLEGKIKKAEHAAEAIPWRRLLAQEELRLEEARRQFWEDYAPGVLAELRAGFDALPLGAQPATAPSV
jgi:CHAD domain-containing protein